MNNKYLFPHWTLAILASGLVTLTPGAPARHNSTSMTTASSVPARTSPSTAAIAAAKPGDTINVCPGIYREQVIVRRRLLIQGLGVGNMNQAIIAPNASAATTPVFVR